VAVETFGIVDQIFVFFQTLLAYFGAAVIAFGGVIAIYHTLRLELRHPASLNYKIIRGGFAARIILGLDFLIASDIMSTIGHPDLNEVLILGGIVLIRTVLTIILSQETREVEPGTMERAPHA
jgi:uncharacterized membrane protein